MKETKKEKTILFKKLTTKDEKSIKGGGEVPGLESFCGAPSDISIPLC
ncbi:MAG: hypothetical protein GY757_48680 [bacterium]|nr:hypothetical protein [bacterium]